MTCSNLHPNTLRLRSYIFFFSLLELALTWHAKSPSESHHTACRLPPPPLLLQAEVHATETVQLITVSWPFVCGFILKKPFRKPINSDSWRAGAQISRKALDTVSCVRPRSLSTSHARVTFDEASSLFFPTTHSFSRFAEPS